MNSSVVTRALGASVRPILREAGFTEFVGKNAWRDSELTIDQVSFRSFNSYLAEGVGCTTFSFGGYAGCYTERWSRI